VTVDSVAIGNYDRDEDLLGAVRADGRPRVRIYPVLDVSVVLGRGSKPEQELHLDRVVADGVPVLRRRGGGCAVVLDPGNVVLSLVVARAGFGGGRAEFAGISEWLVDALKRMGISGVVQRGISDMAIGDRKVGGACIYRPLGLVYYSTTLLVDPDVELSERYLRHPPREPAYREGRPHRDFMGRLAGTWKGVNAPAFARALARTLDPQSPLDTNRLRIELVLPRN